MLLRGINVSLNLGTHASCTFRFEWQLCKTDEAVKTVGR